MSASRRLASQTDREMQESAHNEMVEALNQNPLMKRKFLQTASTSNAVQVVWSHPSDLKDKRNLTYELQYGVGTKVNKVE